MAGSGAPVRQLRRGPAPIASFDHDGSDESSPESKQTFRLPEIREDPGTSGAVLAPPEPRARSLSTPGGALNTPAAPRIDISRASSSSHHDSRDSSPELALFAGTASDDTRGRLELGFREDGALDLRSSTEELAFLEGAPGESRAPPPPPAPAARRHSRKDSQGSEAALLAVSGRTSRLSSVGSQCSAHSALSAFSHQSRLSAGRLSIVSGISRSPSPHRMLLETSFCGPKPIETDPEICAAAVEERLLEIAKMSATSPSGGAPPAVDARDRREVRTEATVERAATRAPPPSPAPLPAPAQPPAPLPAPAPPQPPDSAPPATLDDDKLQKETQNRARAQERRARPRVRREPSEPEVYKSANRSKDIIRIKLKPDDDYEEEEDESSRTVVAEITAEAHVEVARKPASLELSVSARPAATEQPRVRDSRTPSPAGVAVSRKSSFCSLFKSRETIASPDSPSDALRRKRSLTEGRSRSKSRDRSATPTSAAKIRGSVLSLFRTPRKSAASPSPSSREGSPVVQPQRQIAPVPSQFVDKSRRGDKLKYYEDTKDGIIHIPLKTPPDEQPGSSGVRRDSEGNKTTTAEVTAHRSPPRPASAPQPRPGPDREFASNVTKKPVHRTVLPDGSIIIPLRSPTEKTEHVSDGPFSSGVSSVAVSPPASAPAPAQTHPAEVPAQSSTEPASPPQHSAPDASPPAHTMDRVESTHSVDEGRKRRKERLVFTTHVGSREQVFSTQFSITKTPSVTSEISGSFPSFNDGEEVRPAAVGVKAASAGVAGSSTAHSPVSVSAADGTRDSSESEGSSECGTAAPAGDEVEKRVLVVQQSFEEELPYVPTTLPQERSLALPMVPVRERAGVTVAPLQRPRAAPRPPRPAPTPSPAAAPAPAPSDKLRIRLPRRPSTAAPPARRDRPRARSGSDSYDSRPKTEWIDFEEVPERRKQPKRIQTLPAGGVAAVAGDAGGGAGGAALLISYVEPEHCRCECHAANNDHLRSSSPEEAGEGDGEGAPFTADLDLRPDCAPDLQTSQPH